MREKNKGQKDIDILGTLLVRLVGIFRVNLVEAVHAPLCQEAYPAQQARSGASGIGSARESKEVDRVTGVVVVRKEAVGFADVFG
jgi:hypothetical protein